MKRTKAELPADIDLNQFLADFLAEPEPKTEPTAEPKPTHPLLTGEEIEALLTKNDPPHIRAIAQDGDIVLRKGKKYLCTLKDGHLYVRRMGFSKLTRLWQDSSYRIYRPRIKNKDN